jgi:hypothetical protein
MFLFAQEENMIHDSFVVGENIAVDIDIALTETSLNVGLTLENRGTANAMLCSMFPDRGDFFTLKTDGEARSGYYQEDGTLKPPLYPEFDLRFKPEMAKVIEPGQKISFTRQCRIVRTQTTFVIFYDYIDNVFYNPKKIHIDIDLYQFEGDIAKMEKLDFTEGAVVVPNFKKTYLLAEFD